jgi:hypothetical protein
MPGNSKTHVVRYPSPGAQHSTSSLVVNERPGLDQIFNGLIDFWRTGRGACALTLVRLVCHAGRTNRTMATRHNIQDQKHRKRMHSARRRCRKQSKRHSDGLGLGDFSLNVARHTCARGFAFRSKMAATTTSAESGWFGIHEVLCQFANLRSTTNPVCPGRFDRFLRSGGADIVSVTSTDR